MEGKNDATCARNCGHFGVAGEYSAISMYELFTSFCPAVSLKKNVDLGLLGLLCFKDKMQN